MIRLTTAHTLTQFFMICCVNLCLSVSRIVYPLLALNANTVFSMWRCRFWETIKKWRSLRAQLIKHHAMKTWRDGGISPPLLTSALDGGGWSASYPGRFTPGERAPGTHLIGWMGPRACCREEKKLASVGIRTTPGVQHVVHRHDVDLKVDFYTSAVWQRSNGALVQRPLSWWTLY
jgi:hypothetical protein